jgi:hypothetical protein
VSQIRTCCGFLVRRNITHPSMSHLSEHVKFLAVAVRVDILTCISRLVYNFKFLAIAVRINIFVDIDRLTNQPEGSKIFPEFIFPNKKTRNDFLATITCRRVSENQLSSIMVLIIFLIFMLRDVSEATLNLLRTCV